jgi:hypothetical protein
LAIRSSQRDITLRYGSAHDPHLRLAVRFMLAASAASLSPSGDFALDVPLGLFEIFDVIRSILFACAPDVLYSIPQTEIEVFSDLDTLDTA